MEFRKQTWFLNQYAHPHETRHTFDQVLKWLDVAGFEFVNSFPKLSLFGLPASQLLLARHGCGTSFEHFLIELGMVLSGGKEGGFFIIIGRKR